MSRVLNAEGADNGLDVGVSLLTFGLLPQRVLLHGEAGDPDPGMRPRPHPQDLRRLSFSSQDMTFPPPFFDFGEKDCIQLTHFVPPSNDSKGEEGGDEDLVLNNVRTVRTPQTQAAPSNLTLSSPAEHREG
ncbi:unnamed protein product [Arctogadus glacialis]